MNDLPASIKYPDTFKRTAPPAFDGAFDWSWTAECWGNPRDKPMDIDGFKERRGHCLFFETKNPGAPIPKGQLIGLRSLHSLGKVSIMLIWGKTEPVHGEFWFPGTRHIEKFEGVEQAKNLVRRWYRFANGE